MEDKLMKLTISPLEVRSKIIELEERMRKHPRAVIGDSDQNPLKHSFADGCYVREIFNPAHELIVTKIHKISHPYFLLQGDMSILTETGAKRIKAPHYGITPAGTKRVIWTHTNCIFVTVHVTKERDLEKIEAEVIAKDWDEMGKEEEIINLLEETLESEGVLCLG